MARGKTAGIGTGAARGAGGGAGSTGGGGGGMGVVMGDTNGVVELMVMMGIKGEFLAGRK